MPVSGFQIFKKLVRPLSGRGWGRYRLIAGLYQRLFNQLRPTGLILLSIQGQKMYIDTADTSLSPSLPMLGIWEPGTTKLFRTLLKPGMVVIDVGANVGYYTLIAASVVGTQGRVYAFEPEPHNCDLIAKNVQLNGHQNVTTVCQAVSDKQGESKLALHPTGRGAHRLAISEDIGRKQTISVKTISLDEFFGCIHTPVDLVKIDVEGFEPAVFQGMRGIVRQNPNIKLLIEFYPRIIQQCGYSAKSFLMEIRQTGLNIFKIDESSGRIYEISDIDQTLDAIQNDTSFNILCSRFIPEVI